jgi:ribosome-associated toxin RatA of RatAB toxin-antitoxin module
MTAAGRSGEADGDRRGGTIAAMRDETTVTKVIDAPPDRCYALVADIDRYPEWSADIKQAEVITRDEDGRPVDVAFRAAAMGRSTSYTLRYDYSEAPHRLSWVLVDGDIARKLDGYYAFAPVEDDADQTSVTYHLEVELVVPLPGFVKRRAEGRIVHTALDDLKVRAEA